MKDSRDASISQMLYETVSRFQSPEDGRGERSAMHEQVGEDNARHIFPPNSQALNGSSSIRCVEHLGSIRISRVAHARRQQVDQTGGVAADIDG